MTRVLYDTCSECGEKRVLPYRTEELCSLCYNKKRRDIASVEDQLKQWVKGFPKHNKVTDERCPDFSCCNGNIADLETRKRFQKAHVEKDEDTKMQMLMMFLGKVIHNDINLQWGEEA